jgi:predicted TIM-barrel fold metal-dependent hydrolase
VSVDCRAVDCHAHVFDPSLPLARDRRYTPGRIATLDEYLGLLDANGIAHGVLTAPSFLGTDNGQLLAALERADGRLRGTVIVEPTIGRDELDRMAAAGVVGIRLNLFERPRLPDLGTSDYRRLLEHVLDLDWHMGIYTESPKLVQLLPPLRAAGVRIVVDHFGTPVSDAGMACPGFAALLGALAEGRTWVKVSAPYRVPGVDLRACAATLLKAGGDTRLVWGSDWPWLRYEKGLTYDGLLAELAAHVPDPATRARVLGANALELFHIPITKPS